MNSAALSCTDCPPDFDGSGETGCIPKLAQLATSAGELAPAFSPRCSSIACACHSSRRTSRYWRRHRTAHNYCFGFAVALADDLIAVGANWENGSSRGLGGDPTQRYLAHSGAAYLFARTHEGWKSSTYIKASNSSENAGFGASIALGADLLVVGALGQSSSATGVNPSGDDESAPGAGAVYLYR